MNRFIWMTKLTYILLSLPIIILTVLSHECVPGTRQRTKCYNNKATINLGLTMWTKHFYVTISSSNPMK